jgi:beta-phosphoglucomutase
MYDAVIFDFDGVIADTMQDNFWAWKKTFNAYNIVLQEEDFFPLEGMSRFEIAKNITDKYRISVSNLQDLVNQKDSYYLADNHFKIYPAIFFIFDLLQQKNIKTAIVTGASRDRISQFLPEKIKNQLTTIVTSDDVKQNKPHPEPYLKAIEKLNISATKSLVIENAIFGIQAAKTANCTCFALTTTLPSERLLAADKIFATHEDLFAFLQKYI